MRLSTILCVISLALFFNVTSAQTDAEYEAQLKKLEKTIQSLQKQLRKVKGSRAALQKDLQRSEEEISGLTQEIERIKEALRQEKKQLNQYQGQRTELELARKKQEREVVRIVKNAYLLGRESHIKLLLNQEKPDIVSRLLEYHNYVVEAHRLKIVRFRQTITEIEAVEANIRISSEKLEKTQQTLVEQFDILKMRQRERLATIAKVNQQLKSQGGRLSKLRDDRKRLESLLTEATQALSELTLPIDSVPFASVKGKLPFPSTGRILHRFGTSKVKGKLRWNGIFITGSAGGSVRAVHHGRVIFSDYLRGQGLLLIVDHGHGYMSLYAHNQTLLKETGDWVSSGERIATQGNTGGQVETGLYFEIRYRGKPQNPTRWLARLKS